MVLWQVLFAALPYSRHQHVANIPVLSKQVRSKCQSFDVPKSIAWAGIRFQVKAKGSNMLEWDASLLMFITPRPGTKCRRVVAHIILAAFFQPWAVALESRSSIITLELGKTNSTARVRD